MKVNTVFTLCLILLVPLPASAHSGHDHTSIFSSLIHLLWLTPALVALVLLHTHLLKKNYKMKSSKTVLKDDNHAL